MNAIHYYGHSHCDFALTSTAQLEWYIPVGSTEVIATTKTIPFGYTIGDNGLSNSDFCRYGWAFTMTYNNANDY